MNNKITIQNEPVSLIDLNKIKEELANQKTKKLIEITPNNFKILERMEG